MAFSRKDVYASSDDILCCCGGGCLLIAADIGVGWVRKSDIDVLAGWYRQWVFIFMFLLAGRRWAMTQ